MLLELVLGARFQYGCDVKVSEHYGPRRTDGLGDSWVGGVAARNLK